MKIYYLCDTCEMVVNAEETDGGEGLVFLRTVCDDCAQEMGLVDTGHNRYSTFYN